MIKIICIYMQFLAYANSPRFRFQRVSRSVVRLLLIVRFHHCSLIVAAKFKKHSLWQEVPNKLIFHVFRGGEVSTNFYRSPRSKYDSPFPIASSGENVQFRKSVPRTTFCVTLLLKKKGLDTV